MNTSLWTLAFFGAFAGAVGDVLCVLAARTGQNYWVLVAAGLYALIAPVWFTMSRVSKGEFAAPAVAWSAMGSLLSIVAVLVLDKHLSFRQWTGLLLVIAGVLVRG